jgi:hypothetical protein
LNPVSASPVLREARALGRAFRGAGAALGRFETWFLLLALGVAAPWMLLLACEWFGRWGPDPPEPFLQTLEGRALSAAVHCAIAVLMIALLAPVLAGERVISLRSLRPRAMRLIVAAAALAGAELAWLLLFVTGLLHGFPGAPWWAGATTLELVVSLVEAWVIAFVLVSLRDGSGWPWGARHLLLGGALLFTGSLGTTAMVEPMMAWLDLDPWTFGDATASAPPPWWVVWRVGDSLVVLIALEYLRIVQAAPPAPAGAPA